MKPTVINVVSGKGGTGKTLLACVLADMLGNSGDTRVLVVDLDFFVRGLTSLLYFHSEERLHIVRENEVPVADLFVQKIITPLSPPHRIAIAKYRSFDVTPAVSRIDQRLNFQDLGPDNRNEALQILKNLLALVPTDYRFVILDSRAGYDELIAATHEVSDVSCVEEDDPISRVTSDNLIAQLTVEDKTPIFRLINKSRETPRSEVGGRGFGVNDLGRIPFDMDIMSSFGAPDFWEKVTRSIYKWALVQAWNRLSQKLQLGVELSSFRLSPIANMSVESRIGLLGLKERVLFVYGLALAGFGLMYGLLGREMLFVLREDPLRLASVLIGISGVAISIFAFLKKK